MIFNLARFCHYYVAYAPAYKVRQLTFQHVGVINSLPAIGGC